MNDPRSYGARPSILRRLLRFTIFLMLMTTVPLVGAVGAITWAISDQALHPETIDSPWEIDDFSSLEAEDVTFRGSTGIALSGRFFRGTSEATVILSHGFAVTQDLMLPWVYVLNDAGFNVFTYDMRGQGQSDGEFVTFGALEQYDLISAVDYLTTRPDVDPERVAAAGLSLGGSVSILAAARDPRIKAVVSVSGFSDAESVVNSNFERMFDLPAFPFADITVAISEQRSGAKIDDVRPVDVIDSISPRPVLLMHGTDDEVVSWTSSRRNFDAARAPKKLIWVPNGGHNLRDQLFWGDEKDAILEFLIDALAEERVNVAVSDGERFGSASDP